MAVPIRETITLADFEAFASLPANSDHTFEFVGGEIVEVPSNPLASKIAMLIGSALLAYLRENDIGHVTGADGGYMVGGERYVPDAAFISYARQPELPALGYNPAPPDLAVEVVSDPASGEEQRRLRFKVSHYTAAGTLVWVVNPAQQTVEVHAPGQPAQLVGRDGTLTAACLPGFALPLKAIFPQQSEPTG
jgi:Uma2 family endonuclease